MSRISNVMADGMDESKFAQFETCDRYPWVSESRDQAEAADLLTADIGKIPWVKEVLDQVVSIILETVRHEALIEKVNRDAKALYEQQDEPNCTESAFLSSLAELDLEDPFSSLEESNTLLREPVEHAPFCSIQKSVETWLTAVPMLRRVIDTQEFESKLFKVSGNSAKERRDRYVKMVKSAEFYGSVLAVNRILRLCRSYFKVFDDDHVCISDVFPKTMRLMYELERVPLCRFLTAKRSNDVLNVFRQRWDGPVVTEADSETESDEERIRLIENVHVAACLLNPYECPKEIGSFLPSLRAQVMTYLRALQALNDELRGESSGWDRIDPASTAIINEFTMLHAKWMSKSGIPRDAREQKDPKATPLEHWLSLRRGQFKNVAEFAIHTPSISASSRAVKRAFSNQSRVQSLPVRDGLNEDQGRKFLFAHWNMRLIEDNMRADVPFMASFASSDLDSDDEYEEHLHDWDTESETESL